MHPEPETPKAHPSFPGIQAQLRALFPCDYERTHRAMPAERRANANAFPPALVAVFFPGSSPIDERRTLPLNRRREAEFAEGEGEMGAAHSFEL
jgi:hypothetical protein